MPKLHSFLKPIGTLISGWHVNYTEYKAMQDYKLVKVATNNIVSGNSLRAISKGTS